MITCELESLVGRSIRELQRSFLSFYFFFFLETVGGCFVDLRN